MAGDVSQGYRHVSAALIVLHFIREEMRSVTGRPQGVLSPLLSRVGGREGGGYIYEQAKQVGVGDEWQDGGFSEQEVWDAFG